VNTGSRTEHEPADDRPPICPACGVTMGITVREDGSTRFVCLECGYPTEDVDAETFPDGTRLSGDRVRER